MPEYKSFEEIFADKPAVEEAPKDEAPKEPVEAPEPESEEPAEEPEEPTEEPEVPEEAPAEEPPEPAAEPKPGKKKKEEKAPEPRIRKVTVDGKELEVDDEELVRGYTTGRAASQRFQEAKQMHEEAGAFFQAFLRSPGDALTDLIAKRIGDRTKAREQVRDAFLEFLAPELEESLISDERERALHRRKREIEDRQKELDRRQAEDAQRITEAEMTKFVGELRTQIGTGLKKHGLPDRDEIWVRAGQLVDLALKAGQKREHVIELVPAVMKQIADEREEAAKKLAATLSPEQVERMFPDAIEKLKQQRIAAVKEARAKKTPAGEMKPVAKPGTKTKYKSMDEIFGRR